MDWKDKSASFLSVHRMAVDPSSQGQGIGKALMSFVEELVLKRGLKSIRLDTYSGNPIMLKFLERTGFERLGSF